jgi:Domain of unknown function (DUF2382)/PRC-barrel domain
MPAPSIESARGWLGRTMVDRDSNRIGEIVDIYLDNETDQPEWAVVRTGLFGMRSTFVPLAEATEVGDELQVPHHRMEVKQAPNIEPGGQLSAAEEAELYRHYGLDYDTVTLADGSSAGQAQAEPAGEPKTTTPETRSASFNPEPDASSMEAAQGRRDAGQELAATIGSDPVGTAGQDRHPVDEEVSQPFVYETPARPEGNAGTRRRQPGQVRLRRYLVTEVVTETESGQRHEVRVQREPVSDAEVDAATAAPDRQGEAIGQESTGSDHNDWFTDPGDPRR